jgi:Ca2+-binding EF-hand superfamily protein
MKIKKYAIVLAMAALTLPLIGFAGHHYGGHGDMDMVWDMTVLDKDSDGVLTFDEFISPNVKKWRSGFDMIDTDGNGQVSVDEWKVFTELHGMKPAQ